MKFLDKLKSSNGETISETLVATLIAALSMVMFASMVIASKNIISNSKSVMENYYSCNSKMMTSRASGGGEVKTESVKIIFTNPPVYANDFETDLYSNQMADGSIENDIQLKCY